jgi:hypothetical protein
MLPSYFKNILILPSISSINKQYYLKNVNIAAFTIITLLLSEINALADVGGEYIEPFIKAAMWIYFFLLLLILWFCRKWPYRGITFFLIGLSPLIYIFYNRAFEYFKYENKKNKERANYKQLVELARPYLDNHCNDVRRISNPFVVDASGGLIIVNAEKKLDLKTVSSNNSNKHIYAKQYSEPSHWATVKDDNYLWPGYFTARKVLLNSPFAFVERDVSSHLQMFALKSWWESSINTVIVKNRDFLKSNLKVSDGSTIISALIGKSYAKYELNIRDISTTNDRDNFVARVQITLTNQVKNKIVAEYIGLSSIRLPDIHLGLKQKDEVCRGTEEKYLKFVDLYGTHQFDVVEFFFNEVVKYR